MKKLFYYTTAALVISCGMAQAQTCVPTPDCQTLGYTSSSYCSGGIKCPFGEAWNCDLANKVTEIETKVEEVEAIVTRPNNALQFCGIGNIFYSDWTCSVELDNSKTPIGVVVYDDGLGHGQVMALNSIGTYEWGVSGDIPTLPNYDSEEVVQNDLGSCANSAKIMAQGDSSTYPAVWAAYNYSTEGTKVGDWCLPAAGIFTSIYNNQTIINTGFSRAGGTTFTIYTYAWSSSEISENYFHYAWLLNLKFEYGLSYAPRGSNYLNVFPVLVF